MHAIEQSGGQKTSHPIGKRPIVCAFHAREAAIAGTNAVDYFGETQSGTEPTAVAQDPSGN